VYTDDKGVFAREVNGIDAESMLYQEYNISDGAGRARRRCSRAAFEEWAVRLCTLQEMRQLGKKVSNTPEHAKQRSEEVMRRTVQVALECASDEQLLEEVRRRELSL
jgi:hypothetical protein